MHPPPPSSQGTYWLGIQGVGEGDAATGGFTAYGSMGPYKLTIKVSREPPPACTAANCASCEPDSATACQTCNATYTLQANKTCLGARAVGRGGR